MFTIFVAIVAVLVIASYVRGGRARRRALIAAAPRPIAELPEDTLGRIAGVARAQGEPLTAPFSGKPCVYYLARVEREATAAHGADPWDAIANEARALPFILEDATGRALIEPTAAKLSLWFSPPVELAPGDPRPASVAALLARQHAADPAVRLRYLEAVIEVGQTISVFGAGVREPDPAAAPTTGDPDEPTTLLRITSTPRRPIQIIDDAPAPAVFPVRASG